MAYSNCRDLDESTLRAKPAVVASVAPEKKPWHAPQVTALEIRSTLSKIGSFSDGFGPSVVSV